MKVKFNVKADEPNGNGVVFTKEALRNAFKEYVKVQVEEDKAVGQLGQPKHDDIELHKSAFLVKEINEVDNDYVGDIEIIGTPSGEELKKIIEDAENFRIVTFGFGHTSKSDEDENITIVDNYVITSVGIEPKENCA